MRPDLHEPAEASYWDEYHEHLEACVRELEAKFMRDAHLHIFPGSDGEYIVAVSFDGFYYRKSYEDINAACDNATIAMSMACEQFLTKALLKGEV